MFLISSLKSITFYTTTNVILETRFVFIFSNEKIILSMALGVSIWQILVNLSWKYPKNSGFFVIIK